MTLTQEAMRNWWDDAARKNAMTGILSGNSDWNPDEFFQSGRTWLAEISPLAVAAQRELRGEAALDFGCGIGRMTHALAERYQRVTGVDISPEMISLANKHKGELPIDFKVAGATLPLADQSVDLSFSVIVVQHIPFPHNSIAITEMFRVSRDLVLFDAPSAIIPGTYPGDGIFMLPMTTVLDAAAALAFELVSLRKFRVTETRHFQYLFQRT